MNSAPSIVAFEPLLTALPPAGTQSDVARLTVEFGPLVISGMRLCISDRGSFFFRPPNTRRGDDRVIFRPGQERTALLTEATHMLRQRLAARSAETPVATASPYLETAPDDPPRTS
ncbi:hypothetical protein [Rhodovarius lipocyclicus]|uniref:hypothetical protein n=1 Tax=Rhodovarius lipocyclicus TaxID=268410 RepID=UPI00135C0896|nr:hypothetical protein [Rhodovarius lipocyclicus]